MYEISLEPLKGFVPIHIEDVFVPHSDKFEGQSQR